LAGLPNCLTSTIDYFAAQWKANTPHLGWWTHVGRPFISSYFEYFPTSKLNELLEHSSIMIRLTKIRSDGDTRVTYYGRTGSSAVVDVALHRMHFFPNDQGQLSYVLSCEAKGYFIDTKFDPSMEQHFAGTVIPLPINGQPTHTDKLADREEIFAYKMASRGGREKTAKDPSGKTHTIIEYKHKKKINPLAVVFFDTETYLDAEDTHTPYLVCAKTIKFKSDPNEPVETISNKHWWGTDCIDDFLKYLISLVPSVERVPTRKGVQRKKNAKTAATTVAVVGAGAPKPTICSTVRSVLCYAHNLSFDIAHIMGKLTNVAERYIVTGTRTKMVEGEYTHAGETVKIIFKDSMSFIGGRLEDFPAMFGFTGHYKYKFPYELVTNPYMDESDLTMTPDEILKLVPDFDGIDSLPVEPDGRINLYSHAIKYCATDVELLSMGVSVMRQRLYNLITFDDVEKKFIPCYLDMYDMISISQYAFEHQKQWGCYDGVNSLSGTVSAFIRKCIVGGRVMANSNATPIEHKHPAINLDANSLYPSAMATIRGYPKGIPSLLTEAELKSISDGESLSKAWFAEAEVLTVGKPRTFPLLSVWKDSTRVFTNDMVGKIVYIDNITAYECARHQDMKFRFIRGYVFDGYNTAIGEWTRTFYNYRKELVAAKNPLENTIKLLLNSAYGKNIQKPILTRKVMFNSEAQLDKYMQHNHIWVKSAVKAGLNDKTPVFYANVRSTKIFKDKSFPHCASLILSKSKAIMNEAICAAEDANITVAYQDTDSMFVLGSETETPAEAVKRLNTQLVNGGHRELIGTELGQFKSDWKVKGKDATGHDLIILGKKSYYLKQINSDGQMQEKTALKGITKKAIIAGSKRWASETSSGMREMYQWLMTNPYEFDNSAGCIMLKNCQLKYKKNKSAIRTLCFQ
jgi:hypothetical protein